MLTYDEALDYLSGLLKFGIKFGLDRFTELCRRMGNPQDSLRVIHVGGTNGKGSTCTFISSILRAAGYNVGTYLSPYVYDVRERIQVNGEMISKDDFAALMTEMIPVMESVGKTDLGQVTEFEAKTLMAFLHFARSNLDCSVIEVGMGGRYDATNLVHPLVTVITNASLDHTDRLGDTIEKIAWDKTGIVKTGVPLVTAANAECGMRNGCWVLGVGCRVLEGAWKTIFNTAKEQGVGQIWRVMKIGCEPPSDSPKADVNITYEGRDGEVIINLPDMQIGPITLRLAGDFQSVNAATAAAAISALVKTHSSFLIPHSSIETGLSSAYLPGRLEVIRNNPTVVIDAAHNPDAAEKLAQSMRKLFHYQKLILVIGMITGHSAEDVLKILAPLADEIIVTKSQWEKAQPASEVAKAARKFTPNVRIIEPVPDAAKTAVKSASEDDFVLITGSFYTIGEVDRKEL